jgi:hypothetical protein
MVYSFSKSAIVLLINDDLASCVADQGWGRMEDVSVEHACRVAMRFAKLLPENNRSIVHHELRVEPTATARARSMSSFVGVKAQPMHTDGAFSPEPPRYLVFHCIDPGASGRSTLIWSFEPNYSATASISSLFRVSWVSGSRRGRSFYCPVLDRVKGVPRIRFDPLCMKRVRTGPSHSAVTAAIRASSREASVEWKEGNLLVLDNWRCLHARSAARSNLATDFRRIGRWTIGGA